ncbi:MurR/RpiR family transcriptional regulator [Macrococcus animalis]|uniref:MurR/RpiR family transcriptional regulator n=1 Tax=Macrococcus animalis TaxID=3395467 RepID=UPI0039BE3472
MNPLMYIKEHMNQLTKQEQRVANYVVDFPVEAVQLSAKEIGDKTATSSATVIRFVKKMKYKGFNEFKVNISRHIPDDDISVFKRVDKDESIASLKNKLLSRAKYSMEMTSKNIDDEAVENLISVIESSQCIIVYGIGASYLVAQDFYQKFLRLGINVQCTLDTHLISGSLGTYKDNALFVGVSSGGNNSEIQKLLELSVKFGAKTVAITSNSDSKISETSDIVILHDASTEESLRYAATSSLMSQLYAVDVIFYAYLVKHYDDNMNKINDTKEAVKYFTN